MCGGAADQAQKLGVALKGYSTEVVKTAIAQSTLNETQIKAILYQQGLRGETLETTTAELAQITATNRLATSQKGATTSTLGLGTAFKGLGVKIKETSAAIWAFLTTNPVGWMVGVVAAIAGIITVITKVNKKIDEHREKIKETGEDARSTIESLQNDLDNLSSSAEKAIASYAKLIDGVNTLNNTNISLSDEDYDEFISSNNELAELFPELIIGLDEEGNKILALGDNAEEATNKINELIESQRQLVVEETKENLVDVFKGINEETRKASDELESYQKTLSYFDNINYFLTDLQGVAGQAGGKDISLSNAYMEGIDSEILMNNIANIINDELGTDIKVKYSDLTSEWFLDLNDITEEQYEQAIEVLYLNSDLLKDKITGLVECSISDAKDEINRNYTQELSSIYTALSDDIDYVSLSDKQKQLANALISGLDYSEYRDIIKSTYGGDITKFLNKEILDSLYELSDEDKLEVDKIYSELLTIDPDASLGDNIKIIDQYIDELAKILNIDSDKLKITLGYDFSDAEERINQAKIKATGSYTIDARSVSSGTAQIQHAIDELSNDDLTLFLQADITDSTKFETLKDFEDFMESLREQAKVSIDVEAEIDITSPLSDIADAYSAFEDIFNEIESGTTVSASNLDALNDKFGELGGGDSLEKFKEIITTMPDDVNACKEAINQLATEYLDQSELIQNLTTENAEYTESELKKLGVENAHEVVQSRLIQYDYSEIDAQSILVNYSNQLTDAKEKERIASLNLSDATADEIASLINEANAANIDTTALQSYLRQKIQANAITITTNGDISNLTGLVSALGGTITYLQKYQEVKEAITSGKSVTGYWKSDAEYLNQLKYQADKEIKAAFNNSTNANVNYNANLISSSSGSGSSGSSSSSSAQDTTQQYDWIEIAITRVQEAIEKLTTVRDNTYTSWTKRNTALNNEISKITEEINLQEQAYNGYMAKANSIGLSQDYINKIQNGTIQIEDIADDNLQDKIDQYQSFYEKAIECSDAIQELHINLSELAEQKFDNIQTEYDAFISNITAQADIINERINRTEEQGYFVDKQYYQQLINYENQELANLKNEYSSLQSSFDSAVSSGLIVEGSEAWNNMKQEILDVEKAIEESTTSLVEFNNSIRDLNWDIFDYIEERISQITQECDFLIDLLDNSSLYDENGAFNSSGKASTALHGINYNTYMQKSLDYANELKQVESELAKDSNNKDLIERREELLQLQQESILNAESEKDAIKSLVEDGINIHLEALNDLIEKYKDAMDSAKDLYDYQKSIAEQTKNIADLEKVLMAYQGDNSEEAHKIIQETQVSLDEAKQELKETEWDRYISETEDLLDSLYDEYETILNERLDNIDALIADMIEMVNANGSEIQQAINETATKVGYDVTNTLDTIFGDSGKQTTLISNFITKFDTASTTLQTAINDIKNSIQTMMTTPAISTSEGGTSNSISTASSGSNSSSSSSKTTSSSPSTSTQGNGIANIGDLVTYVSGKYHEDSWGNGRSGSQNLNGQVYITKIAASSPYPYHISRGSTLGNGDLGWVTLDQLRGYKTGSKKINGDQWAWTQENGSEVIYDASNKSMLTPLGDKDMVFDAESSKRLWELSQGNFPFINIPSIVPDTNGIRNTGIINNDNNINITLPNVTNYDDFKQQLQSDNKFVGFMQEVTLGQALGKPKLNRKKF